MPTSDLTQMIADADATAAAILEKDRVTPGFAVTVARNIIRHLSTEDARSLIGLQPKPPLVDVAGMIG